MFRLIGIETFPYPNNLDVRSNNMSSEQKLNMDIQKARYHSIMKVLKPNCTFWFYEGYKKEDGKYQRTEEATPDDFYPCGCTNVSISAIVAENGMGKSSLLELCFRIINNVAYALREGLPVHKSHLCFVRNLYARVIMEIEGGFSSIEQRDNLIIFQDQSNPENNWSFDFDAPNMETPSEAIAKLSRLFYTIVVNYSQYAYNVNDYVAEWNETDYDAQGNYGEKCWIASLFHKNDAYQTPIVLSPFRENGNIDVNVEKELAHNRLFQLITTSPRVLNLVLQNKYARSFIFDVEDSLNPVGNHRFSSLKVLRMMEKMQLIPSIKGGIALRNVAKIGQRILAAWGRVLGYRIEPQKSEDYWNDMDVVRTLNYIVYKTLKISITYSQYFRFRDCFDDKVELLKYVYNLKMDHSHVTLKIRRCIAFLYFRHYGTGHYEDGHLVGNEMGLDEFYDVVEKCLVESGGVYERLVSDKPVRPYRHDADDYEVFSWTLDDLFPAPSFKADIILEDCQHNLIRFSSLSSGEKQMIYSMCTVMYQLKNLDSVWRNEAQDGVKYENVNLVFDEIELYSHPKYQQMFVYMLINSIKSMNLDGVRNINIIIATHSPFILSDLPSSNILCLIEGMPMPREAGIPNSFCANIFDILSSRFFMNKFVGTFASEKLRKLTDKIQTYRGNPTKELREEIMAAIRFYGDEYLRLKLEKAMEI